MRDIKIVNSDIDLGAYGIELVSGLDYIEQKLKIALRLFKGEWFLDISKGVTYYEDILVKNYDGSRIEAVLKTVILGVPGVLELLSFDMNYDNTRKLTVSFSVSTDLGELELIEVL